MYEKGVFAVLNVIKRNGDVTEFTLTKICDAIIKAFHATDMQFTNDIVDLLALRVTADFQSKVKESEIHIEDVQDSVERVLEQAGYAEVAKAYILYRQKRSEARETKNVVVEVGKTMDEYLEKSDRRVNANANSGYSL